MRPVTPEADEGTGSGRRCMRHNNVRLLTASRQEPNSYRNERDPEAVL
ncbi:hypothetical protein A2U01_0119381, partial [Trifolium medium]|nr:hypothetical protein [Trifolium medium]